MIYSVAMEANARKTCASIRLNWYELKWSHLQQLSCFESNTSLLSRLIDRSSDRRKVMWLFFLLCTKEFKSTKPLYFGWFSSRLCIGECGWVEMCTNVSSADFVGKLEYFEKQNLSLSRSMSNSLKSCEKFATQISLSLQYFLEVITFYHSWVLKPLLLLPKFGGGETKSVSWPNFQPMWLNRVESNTIIQNEIAIQKVKRHVVLVASNQ